MYIWVDQLFTVMKKILLISCLTVPFLSIAQHGQSNAVLRNNILKDYQAPDFSYYSKNYEEVFGRYQYTFDALNTNNRSIFVAPDGNYYSMGDGRQAPFMAVAANTALHYNYNGGDIMSGVLSALTGQSINVGYTLFTSKNKK